MIRIVRVAVPVPLRHNFDYLPPLDGPVPAVGTRVRVPFGRRHLIGVVLAADVPAAVAAHCLKPISAVLDDQPLLPAPLLGLLDWVTRYYHHPPGEVYAAALPRLLRQGRPARRQHNPVWRLSAAGAAAAQGDFRRAPRQVELLTLFARRPQGLTEAELRVAAAKPGPALRRLHARGWIESGAATPAPAAPAAGPPLHPEQAAAVAAIGNEFDRFAVTLVHGVTGSGKTEVYLQLAKQALAAGRQVLVLVPEIGLTPQLVARFSVRLAAPAAVLHSGLTPAQRLEGWLAAGDGDAAIVLGTRSAIFTPLPRLGLIIIDEEHDGSFKQQDGLRYSARDVAVRRAQMAGVPIVLGSATPALETLHNVHAGRYRRTRLQRRATGADAPAVRLLDLRSRPVIEGLSQRLVERVRAHLDDGGQALLFLNRRGYAPALVCHDCGWIAPCRNCDTGMVLHRGGRGLRCHHCGAARAAPAVCQGCGGARLLAIGEGTERVTAALRARLPGIAVARFDRDTTTRKGSLEQMLAQVRDGRTRVLVGTQMLAKGHDFPNLSFVGVVNADHGLFSSDFRACERMAQLVTQVAGRAGRGARPGEVVLQTRHPEHPLLRSLVRHGYEAFANAALAERETGAMPPYGYLALVSAEAGRECAPHAFLEAAVALAATRGHPGVAFWGPAPAPLERRAGRSRAHLLVHAPARARLHRLLDWWIPELAGLPAAKQVRWGLDVDPQDLI